MTVLPRMSWRKLLFAAAGGTALVVATRRRRSSGSVSPPSQPAASPVRVEAPAPARPDGARRRAPRVAAAVIALAVLGALGALAVRHELRTGPAEPFVPSRTWGWPTAKGADRYVIRFYRGDRLVLEGKTTKPRYVLPTGFSFGRGAYRWEVLPVAGGKIGAALVSSRFVVK